MADYRQYKARTVKSAVKMASEDLGVDDKALKYEIIRHGSTGIFGLMGAKKAVIKVDIGKRSIPPVEPENHEEDTTEKSRTSLNVNESDQEYHKTQEITEKGNPSCEDEEARSSLPADDTEWTALKKIAEDMVKMIVEAISEGTRISSRFGRQQFEFQITGGKSAVLIGKRGQTLDAIQYIVEKAVNKKSKDRIRVQVDIEGYLAQRRANLIDMAERMAYRAKKSGKPATLGQMNAYDRRIVHLALKKDQLVRTQSIGEGHMRKLVIFPKKGPYRKRDR